MSVISRPRRCRATYRSFGGASEACEPSQVPSLIRQWLSGVFRTLAESPSTTSQNPTTPHADTLSDGAKQTNVLPFLIHADLSVA